MATTKKTLKELLAEDDEMGLLDVKARVAAPTTDEARVLSGFEEISVFVDRWGFAPGSGPKERRVTVTERALQARLRVYLQSPPIVAALAPFDRHRLLAAPPALEPATLDDVLASDDGLLDDPSNGIFHFKHARPPTARPDWVSERVACADFEKFKPLFDKAAAELASGARRSMQFAQEQEIEPGNFFILNGVMVYVAELNDPHIRNGKRNARLRLIFDNGLEGQNLLRSLATELYKDPNGRRLSDPNLGPLFGDAPATERVEAPTERITGLIYVVRSLSPLPEIAKLDGQLYKIGFTTGSLDDRIRAARDDPTYLMAAVHPVRTYDAVNLSAQRFERLLHWFFADACLDIEVKDRFGKPYRPREWFLLPLPTIERAIEMMIDGSIVRFRYDHRSGEIRPS